jgi:hypothetical protein
MLYIKDAIRKEVRVTTSNKNYSTYYFKCLECDNDITAQSHSLKTHSGKCRRCVQLGIPYLHIYNELKNHGNKKVEFNLTFEEFLEIIKEDKCHYCSSGIIFNKHSKFMSKGLSRAYQLDRKDNYKGYTKDNLVVACWDCNRLKSDRFTYEEFMKFSPILQEIMKERKE